MFRDLDFTLLEMNPFTLDSAGRPFPLDMRGELDDTAAFKSGKKWGPVEFPLPFGRSMTSAEERILAMDENTGARAVAQRMGCAVAVGLRTNRVGTHHIDSLSFLLRRVRLSRQRGGRIDELRGWRAEVEWAY